MEDISNGKNQNQMIGDVWRLKNIGYMPAIKSTTREDLYVGALYDTRMYTWNVNDIYTFQQ